jgi:hypothetical protein
MSEGDRMKKKGFTAEQVARKLREAEILLAKRAQLVKRFASSG